MRRTGKILPFLLLAALCAGCSAGQGPRGQGRMEEESESEPAEDLIVVGFSQVGSESDWRTANTASVRSALTEENGFYLIFEDAQQKQENQLKAIRSFIMQEVDYIVLAPIVETGWDAVFQEAKNAGIPVILADREADVPEELYTCWIGPDTRKEGERAGRWLADYLEEQGRGGEEIRIVTIQGTAGSSAQLGRTEGFADVMREHENWTILDMRDGDFTQAKGQEVMEDFLDAYKDIDVVVCENDNMAFGAIDAIQAAGLTCGPDGDIIILSFDAVRAALEAMIAGEINAVFECNPLQGPWLAEAIKTLDGGGTLEKKQYIEETYFDTGMDLESILKTRAY